MVRALGLTAASHLPLHRRFDSPDKIAWQRRLGQPAPFKKYSAALRAYCGLWQLMPCPIWIMYTLLEELVVAGNLAKTDERGMRHDRALLLVTSVFSSRILWQEAVDDANAAPWPRSVVPKTVLRKDYDYLQVIRQK